MLNLILDSVKNIKKIKKFKTNEEYIAFTDRRHPKSMGDSICIITSTGDVFSYGISDAITYTSGQAVAYGTGKAINYGDGDASNLGTGDATTFGKGHARCCGGGGGIAITWGTGNASTDGSGSAYAHGNGNATVYGEERGNAYTDGDGDALSESGNAIAKGNGYAHSGHCEGLFTLSISHGTGGALNLGEGYAIAFQGIAQSYKGMAISYGILAISGNRSTFDLDDKSTWSNEKAECFGVNGSAAVYGDGIAITHKGGKNSSALSVYQKNAICLGGGTSLKLTRKCL